MAIRVYGSSFTSYDKWVGLIVYTLFDRVIPIIPDGQCYECTTAGTSGGSEPSWDSTPGNTTEDGTVVWTCRDIPSSPGTLTAVINTSGQGSLALLEIWVKSDVESEFLIYGSHSGADNTWRLVDELGIPTKQGKYETHDGYFNAYHFVKVSVEEVGIHEIEIIAGEM